MFNASNLPFCVFKTNIIFSDVVNIWSKRVLFLTCANSCQDKNGLLIFYLVKNYLILLLYPETAAVDTGTEPDEEKPETPVKICFVELK